MIPEYSKDISAVAYILPVGWIVALVFRKLGDDQTEFTVFHLRQGLGLSLIDLVLFGLGKAVDNAVLTSLLVVIVAWLSYVGIRGVRKGVKRYQPFFGRKFDEWFEFIS